MIKPVFKMVICGKYKNLNKITKIQDISLKFHRLLIFVILYSLQAKKWRKGNKSYSQKDYNSSKTMKGYKMIKPVFKNGDLW